MSEDRKRLFFLIAIAVLLVLTLIGLIGSFRSEGSFLNTIISREGRSGSGTGRVDTTDQGIQYDEDGNPIPGTGGGSEGGGAGNGGTDSVPLLDNGTPVGETVLPQDIIPHDWINDYYADLMSQRWQSALGRLPLSIRSGLTADQLQLKTERDPIGSVSSEGSAVDADQTTAEVTSVIIYQSGQTSTQTWLFEKQGGNWVIVGRTIEGMPE
ncbi:MAG: hypothetical protein FWE87_06275 [Coriobacteriia bacterium]|nr:hypothetical protein [Coriobacteriia bacterium]